eukprot:398990_1
MQLRYQYSEHNYHIDHKDIHRTNPQRKLNLFNANSINFSNTNSIIYPTRIRPFTQSIIQHELEQVLNANTMELKNTKLRQYEQQELEEFAFAGQREWFSLFSYSLYRCEPIYFMSQLVEFKFK